MTVSATHTICSAIDHLALAQGKSLPPGWADEIDEAELAGDVADIARVCSKMGWAISDGAGHGLNISWSAEKHLRG